MDKKRGFTLIELMIVVSVLGILAIASSDLFYRTLRGTNKSESMIEVEKNAQFALTSMERFARSARKVTSVGSSPCQVGTPVTGTTLTMQASDEVPVTFSLSSGRLASNSAYLTAPEVVVDNLLFTCTRTEGAPDQVIVTFRMTHTTTAADVTTQRTYTKTINLRNFL